MSVQISIEDAQAIARVLDAHCHDLRITMIKCAELLGARSEEVRTAKEALRSTERLLARVKGAMGGFSVRFTT